MKKEYTNGEITIVWRPELCIHAGNCVKTLPEVYKPKEKPWIQIENATTADIEQQVPTCPSGALSYYYNDKNSQGSLSPEVKIKAKNNGPLLVTGTIEVENPDGTTIVKDKSTAFCRCGLSDNKPYCDGAHVAGNFKG